MRQVFQRSRLGEPYDSMVVRSHDLLLELLGAAQRGDRNAVQTVSERLVSQARALVDLLKMKNKKEVGL